MDKNEIVLDIKALEAMGLHSEAIYTIEYDLNSELKIHKNSTPEEKKQAKIMNDLAREFRNKLQFILKFKLQATKHLESCWLISESNLETAVNDLSELKDAMRNKGFKDVDKRLRIIPILTTIEGFESYEEKKAEFLLSFAMEHIKYCDLAIKTKKMPRGTMWRCKEAYSIINGLKEELKKNKRYHELVDTVGVLGERISLAEVQLKPETEKEA